MAANQLHVLLNNDYSIRIYQLFVSIFKNISYFAGIMLNAFVDLLCSKLCWHNRLVPNYSTAALCNIAISIYRYICTHVTMYVATGVMSTVWTAAACCM